MRLMTTNQQKKVEFVKSIKGRYQISFGVDWKNNLFLHQLF